MNRALTKHLMTKGMAKKRDYFGWQHKPSCAIAHCCPAQTTNTKAAKPSFSRHPTYNSFFPEEQSTMDWVKDDTVKNCMRCNVPFTALRRKHHCRVLFVCFGDEPRFARRCSAIPALPSVFRSMVPWSESARTATPRKRVCERCDG